MGLKDVHMHVPNVNESLRAAFDVSNLLLRDGLDSVLTLLE